MPQHQDLQLLGAFPAPQQHHQLEQTAGKDVHGQHGHDQPPEDGGDDATPISTVQAGSTHPAAQSSLCTQRAEPRAVLPTPRPAATALLPKRGSTWGTRRGILCPSSVTTDPYSAGASPQDSSSGSSAELRCRKTRTPSKCTRFLEPWMCHAREPRSALAHTIRRSLCSDKLCLFLRPVIREKQRFSHEDVRNNWPVKRWTPPRIS